jgi:WD40 repeat protein
MQEAATLHGHDGPVSVVAFSPSGSLLVSAAEGVVRLWKAPTFEELFAAERIIEAKNETAKQTQTTHALPKAQPGR